MNKPRLRASVSVVSLENNIIEFFLTNTREQVRIRMSNKKILELILSLDGKLTIDEIMAKYNIDSEGKKYFIRFINYLESKGVLQDYNGRQIYEYSKYRRVINFLEDFSSDFKCIESMWNNIIGSHVVIVGLGAVGSWVASLLVQSGVCNFTVIDDDVVDITNLHRQFGFSESDIGKRKTDVVEERIKEFNKKARINKINKFLDENLLNSEIKYHVDLIINCADSPNVDTTSLWIGQYCMANNIPHIIGGGYNLHLSLIGQTIIPFKSACVKCFETELIKINEIDIKSLKKLNVRNRKIGSFGPMCSIIASMIAMESIKVLTKKIIPTNLNRRGEFNIHDMKIKYHNINKNHKCEWCGENGRYNNLDERNRSNID